MPRTLEIQASPNSIKLRDSNLSLRKTPDQVGLPDKTHSWFLILLQDPRAREITLRKANHEIVYKSSKIVPLGAPPRKLLTGKANSKRRTLTRAHNMRKFSIAAILCLTLCVAVWRARGGIPEQTTRFPSARTQKDGDLWLAWNKSMREGFVRGYLSGYKDGHNEGCGEAIRFFVPEGTVLKGPDPDAHCENAQSLLSQEPDQYAEQVTTFYTTYSTDREIPLPMMLWLLSDQQNKNPKQIHEWFVNGGNRNLTSLRK
jgi:hypothetical protein